MKKKWSFSFWLILIITVIALLIDLSQVSLSLSPTIPFLNKKIAINLPINKTITFVLQKANINRELSFQKGLDLAGGTSITLKAEMDKISKDQKDNALFSAKEVIERRVNLFGVKESVVQTAITNNDYRIIVELPGVTNLSEARSLVGTTAQLEFWELPEKATTAAELYLGSKPTGLTGADLKNAQVTFDQNSGEPVVAFSVVDASQQKFYDATKKIVGKRMAIILDRQYVSAATVREAIRSSGQISGGFTTESAKRLATELNAGALPVSLTPLQEQTIGATLGVSSLNKSLFAGIIGFLIIVIFMIILYKKLGIIASFALVVYVILTLAIFKIIPVVLTLAGIAGFILSIGMAVDANILIFERMREELQRGKPMGMAIEQGFSRAWSSIKDSNISSLITSMILYYFGTGMVRGFAVTLALGVLVSMFSAIFVTRTLLRIFYR